MTENEDNEENRMQCYWIITVIMKSTFQCRIKKKKSDISVNEFSSNEMLGSRTLYFLFFTTQEPHTFFFFLET